VSSLTTSRTVEVAPTGLRLHDGRVLTVMSAAVHSWRHDPADWPRILDAVVSLGFTTVDTYVPWSVHDRGRGAADFTGSRDIAGFLRLAADRGLHATVRPGPNIGAELLDGGIPLRVTDDRRCQALRCNGLPYALPTATHHIRVPSYFSSAFLGEVDAWYDLVCAQLAPLQHPDGPVVTVQVDNEHGFFFQAHPYALDYHPEALGAYRQWLVAECGSLDAVNARYGMRWRSVAEIEPPRDGLDQPEVRRLDWMRWREQALRIGLRCLRERLQARGLDRVPMLHNDYPRLETPLDTGALEPAGTVDIAALDVYATRPGAGYVADVARQLAAASRLPWMAEMGAGWLTLPWLMPMRVSPADAELVWLSALLTGVRACNFFMTVERDRWYGSPVDRHGRVREDFAPLLRRVLRMGGELGLDRMSRTAAVLLVENREQSRRREARSVLGGIVPAFSAQMPFEFRLTALPGPDDAVERSFEAGLRRVLDAASLDWDHAASSSLPDLSRYACVVMPSLDVVDVGAWEALRAAAHRGVTVAVGPRVPRLDASLRAHAFDASGFVVLQSAEELSSLLPRPAFAVSEGTVRLRHWRGDDGEVLAALNHSAQPCTVTLTAASPATLLPYWRDDVPGGALAPSMQLALPEWGVQIWEVRQ
jgi:beta-galactosidase